MIDYSKIFWGYRDRMQKILLFQVFNLSKKKKTDHNGVIIHYMDLVMVSLLFFFENMLSRNYKVAKSDLAGFLKQSCNKVYDMEDNDFVSLADDIIEILRPSDGSKLKLDFYNFETGVQESVTCRFLKVEHWDREQNKQFYTLDEDALELIFATKEFYSEFSLSISQLILRKQLDKGEFHSALRQIDEMRINVNSIKESMNRIKLDIISNIISEDVFQRYKEMIREINERLQREHDEFNELLRFVGESKLKYENNLQQTAESLKLYNVLLKIDYELTSVHNMHTNLLNESIEFKISALEAARESLYHIGIDSFNFDTDIVRKLMGTPIALEHLKEFAEPFLGFSKPSFWSPLRVFERQTIRKNEQESKSTKYIVPDEEDALEQQENEWVQAMYKQAFSLIYSLRKEDFTIRSSEVLEHLKLLQKEGKNSFTKVEIRYIFQFFIIMHQLESVEISKALESEKHIFHYAFKIMEDTFKIVSARDLETVIESDFVQMSDIEILFQ